MEVLYTLLENSIKTTYIFGCGLAVTCFAIFLLPTSGDSQESPDVNSSNGALNSSDNQSPALPSSSSSTPLEAGIDNSQAAEFLPQEFTTGPTPTSSQNTRSSYNNDDADVSDAQPLNSSGSTDQVVLKKFSWAEKGKERLTDDEYSRKDEVNGFSVSSQDSKTEASPSYEIVDPPYIDQFERNRHGEMLYGSDSEESYIRQITAEDYVLDDDESSSSPVTDDSDVVSDGSNLWSFFYNLVLGIINSLFN